MKTLMIMIALIFMIFTCCKSNKKLNLIKSDIAESNQQHNYVLNSKLSLADYAEYERYFPKEGLVPTAEIAVEIADVILSNIFGKENIEEQKPFSINLEGNIWIIDGYLEPGVKGGTAYIEINKENGEILKVSHGK